MISRMRRKQAQAASTHMTRRVSISALEAFSSHIMLMGRARAARRGIMLVCGGEAGASPGF